MLACLGRRGEKHDLSVGEGCDFAVAGVTTYDVFLVVGNVPLGEIGVHGVLVRWHVALLLGDCVGGVLPASRPTRFHGEKARPPALGLTGGCQVCCDSWVYCCYLSDVFGEVVSHPLDLGA